VGCLDIPGGAPEFNKQFRWIYSCCSVIFHVLDALLACCVIVSSCWRQQRGSGVAGHYWWRTRAILNACALA
jgi:hypothetical protein